MIFKKQIEYTFTYKKLVFLKIRWKIQNNFQKS